MDKPLGFRLRPSGLHITKWSEINQDIQVRNNPENNI